MKISNIFTAKAQSSDKLRANIAALEAERDEAEKRLAALKASWRDVLLMDDDSKAAAHQAAEATEQRSIDRAKLKIDPLVVELEAAVAREINASRLAKYEEVRARANDLTKLLFKEHGKIKERIFNLCETLAKAEIDVLAVNAELPEGVDPLPGIEDSVRSRPELPREVIKEEEFEAWSEEGWGYPIAEKHQKSVEKDEYHPGKFFYVDDYGKRLRCVKRRYRRTTFLPAVSGQWSHSLFSAFRWPDLVTGEVTSPGLRHVMQREDFEAVIGRLNFQREHVPDLYPAQQRTPVEDVTPVE